MFAVVPNRYSMGKNKLTKKHKSSLVRRAADGSRIDIKELRALALTPHGFVSSELRRKVWPKLLGLSTDVKMPHYDKDKLLAHRDYQQVVLDVERSIKRFPKAMKDEHRSVLQEQLTSLIMRVLVNNPDLHYYQGYHDVCVTFLLILGKERSYIVTNYLSNHHLRDFMDADMNRTRSMLNYLYPLLRRADSELEAHMARSEVGTIFCLSWLITWFGHVLDDANHIVRLYDVFLASHPLMPLYFAASVVLYRRDKVLAEQPDLCVLHPLLAHVPADLPFDQLIVEACQLFDRFPPETLADEADFEYDKSGTIINYSKFEKAHGLQTSRRKSAILTSADSSYIEASVISKLTMWTITAALGAVVVAMQFISRDLW